jgi:hypothetical protein
VIEVFLRLLVDAVSPPRLRPELAAAAQAVVDEWVQDEDDDLGGGGVCDLVAGAMSAVVAGSLEDVEIVEGGHEGDDHAWLIVVDPNEAVGVDISPDVYETGGGYSWRKREDAMIGPEDVAVWALNRRDVMAASRTAGKWLYEGAFAYQGRIYGLKVRADGQAVAVYQGTPKCLFIRQDDGWLHQAGSQAISNAAIRSLPADLTENLKLTNQTQKMASNESKDYSKAIQQLFVVTAVIKDVRLTLDRLKALVDRKLTSFDQHQPALERLNAALGQLPVQDLKDVSEEIEKMYVAKRYQTAAANETPDPDDLRLQEGPAFHLQADGTWAVEDAPPVVVRDARFSGFLAIEGYWCAVFELNGAEWSQKAAGEVPADSPMAKMSAIARRVAGLEVRHACGRDQKFHEALLAAQRAARSLGAAVASASRLVLRPGPGASIATRRELEQALPVAHAAALALDRLVGSEPEFKAVVGQTINDIRAAGTRLEGSVPGANLSAEVDLVKAANESFGRMLGALKEACEQS